MEDVKQALKIVLILCAVLLIASVFLRQSKINKLKKELLVLEIEKTKLEIELLDRTLFEKQRIINEF